MTTKKKDLVQIAKMFDLQENETVHDLCRKIYKAIYAYLQNKSMWYCDVFAIYMDNVILQDYTNGCWYKVEYTREGEEIMLGEHAEVEIRFVPKGNVAMSDQASSSVERHTLKPNLFEGVL